MSCGRAKSNGALPPSVSMPLVEILNLRFAASLSGSVSVSISVSASVSASVFISIFVSVSVPVFISVPVPVPVPTLYKRDLDDPDERDLYM